MISNSNSFATGDPMSRIVATFPPLIRMQCPSQQART